MWPLLILKLYLFLRFYIETSTRQEEACHLIGNCNLDEIIGKNSRSKTENELNDNAGCYRSHFENMVLFNFTKERKQWDHHEASG